MNVRPLPPQRRHTLYLQEQLRAFSPVFLDTEVDMSAVRAHRAACPRRISTVTHVLHAAARVLAGHPDANAALSGRVSPRIARFSTVSGKLTLDKTLAGQRVVLAAVLPDLDRLELDEIQALVERHRDADPETDPAFAKLRALHRVPPVVGRLLFRLAGRSLAERPGLAGTFAVTSLGHRPVHGFHSVGGTTITFGVGQVTDRPVVRDGAVVVAPVLRLNLAFDHRVLDGAEAADVLTEVKDRLEKVPDAATWPGAVTE
ncbi:2-oxo acid dehydrogenase subunit E2 [Amycolatopsis sp. NPDC049252]|uniref:2-oxo acid dehydrogenase subunit E2 n=1 Tax=Amycolatopsis sp. NPDC049252 TaxID=3363933 RepID=UPI0037208598